MANAGFKNFLLSLSPYIEIAVRKLYWKNIKKTKGLKKQKAAKPVALTDFTKIEGQLKAWGVKPGSLLIAHASYEALANTGKTPRKIIDALLELLGEEGTLAMNAARKFPEEEGAENYLTANYEDVEVVYDVHKSRVWTGVLPHFMLRHSKAQISRFPLNPMVAIGKHAEEMMANNLSEMATACGENSSWNYCVNHDALIVGIGTDLTHSLTAIHVAEDAYEQSWPIKDWYRVRKFKVKDKDQEIEVKVRERRPIWGTLHFAERTLCKDLLANGILKTTVIDGVLIELLNAKELINFLRTKNKSGYPYYL
ncbi:MAG: AAC(3) family N-acetyltransferase [Pedobacter sp.]|nr:MAG: AAC(3) family N-acetyltransferase [Pedobacter sp.]